MRKSKFEQLRERLLRLEYPAVAKFERCYTGHGQRSAGAWSWRAVMPNNLDFGSQLSVTKLLKLDDEQFADWIDF